MLKTHSSLFVIGAYGIRQSVQWVGIIALASYLSPDDMGLANMALVFAGLLILLRDFGLGASIIFMRTDRSADLSTIFWLNCIWAASGATVFFIVAPLAADFFGRHEVAEFIRILAAGFLLSSLSAVHQALLEKDLAFVKVALVETSAIVTATSIAVGSAMNGAGPWSVIIQFVVNAAILFVGYRMVHPFTPTISFEMSVASRAIQYGRSLVGYNVFNYLARNGDKYVIGKLLGAEALGIYAVAYRVVFQPVLAVGVLANRMLFPVLSTHQGDSSQLKSVYFNAVRHFSFVFFPIIAFVGFAGAHIDVLLAPQWHEAGQIIAMLAPLALLQVVGTTVGAIYQATGRTDTLFRWGIFSGLVTVLAVFIGARYGIVGVGTAYTLAGIVLLIPGLSIPLRLVDARIWDVVASVKWFVVATSLSVLAAELACDCNSFVNVGVALLGGILSYFSLIVVVERKFMVSIIRRLRWKS